MAKKQTIALDFDGVIHSYTSGWVDPITIPDSPVPGAFEFIVKAHEEGFDVVIFSARANHRSTDKDDSAKDAPAAIRTWLLKHGLLASIAENIVVTEKKPAAIIYIDDRGWRFEGKFPEFDVIRSLKPWNKAPATQEDSDCMACDIEAEIGDEEEPHPVPEHFHTCTRSGDT